MERWVQWERRVREDLEETLGLKVHPGLLGRGELPVTEVFLALMAFLAQRVPKVSVEALEPLG